MNLNAKERANLAKQKAKLELGNINYSGIGLTRRNGRYAVKVLMPKEPFEDDQLPSEIDGVPIVFQTVGTIRKQAGKPLAKRAAAASSKIRRPRVSVSRSKLVTKD